mgnify:CR=1 FL=1
MIRIITLTHDYRAPPRVVWNIATDMDAYRTAMGRLIAFDGLPSGTIQTGQRIDVRVSLFGILPWQDYTMTVETCDHDAMTFQSDEHGAGINSWRHHLRVIETSQGCRLIDTVEIEAGWKTPFFAAWARIVYQARHKPRLQMLTERGWPGDAS